MAKRKLIQLCTVHENEASYYGRSYLSIGCIECLMRKVDILWEKVMKKKENK